MLSSLTLQLSDESKRVIVTSWYQSFRFSDDTGIRLPSICAVLDLHRHHNTLNNTHGRRVVPLYKQSKESEAQEKRTRGKGSRIVISSYEKAGELKIQETIYYASCGPW